MAWKSFETPTQEIPPDELALLQKPQPGATVSIPDFTYRGNAAPIARLLGTVQSISVNHAVIDIPYAANRTWIRVVPWKDVKREGER